jgi:hypothetical protein
MRFVTHDFRAANSLLTDDLGAIDTTGITGVRGFAWPGEMVSSC